MNVEERLSLYRLLTANPGWVDTFKEALRLESTGEKEWADKGYPYLGWQWFEVHTPVPTLNRMVAERVLDVTMSSRSSTYYKVKDHALVQETIEAIEEFIPAPGAVIPDDLFSIVVGHDRIKWAFKMSLASERPVSILLVGPVATAKTLFLQELARLPESRYLLGSASSKAGIVDYLLEYRPRYLIVDELEKSDGRDLSSLLSLMQTGIVTRLKKNMREQVTITTWVFAGANDTRMIPRELLSRFLVIRLVEYTETEFRHVCEEMLKREDVSETLSTEVITRILPHTRDVRDAIKVARLARNSNDVRELVRLMWRS